MSLSEAAVAERLSEMCECLWGAELSLDQRQLVEHNRPLGTVRRLEQRASQRHHRHLRGRLCECVIRS